MKKMGLTFIYLWLISLCSCQKELIEYEKGDVKICIEQGEQWLHDFPLFLGINKKNPPQIAIWLEDTQGNYLSTVYVTHKILFQSRHSILASIGRKPTKRSSTSLVLFTWS